ncbi:hypothetical protein CRENBAI_003303 [Crenichthys baileyi]|uniref:Uncharacterized protein n=1 Tax=Crenichthys baileyi TaxID=28760 RepID=A0AAV9RNQ5_9TELE
MEISFLGTCSLSSYCPSFLARKSVTVQTDRDSAVACLTFRQQFVCPTGDNAPLASTHHQNQAEAQQLLPRGLLAMLIKSLMKEVQLLSGITRA